MHACWRILLLIASIALVYLGVKGLLHSSCYWSQSDDQSTNKTKRTNPPSPNVTSGRPGGVLPEVDPESENPYGTDGETPDYVDYTTPSSVTPFQPELRPALPEVDSELRNSGEGSDRTLGNGDKTTTPEPDYNNFNTVAGSGGDEYDYTDYDHYASYDYNDYDYVHNDAPCNTSDNCPAGRDCVSGSCICPDGSAWAGEGDGTGGCVTSENCEHNICGPNSICLMQASGSDHYCTCNREFRGNPPSEPCTPVPS